MPRIKLNHVALTVSDREKSVAFYEQYFGFGTRVHDDDHLIILGGDDGAGLLALSQGNPKTDLPRTTHFGFELSSSEQVRALREVFRKQGIEEAEWQETRPTRVQVFDPDGYRVEAYGWE